MAQFPGPGHNIVANLCRRALMSLGKPLNDNRIYSFASKYNGGWELLPHTIAKWAWEQ